MAAKGVITQALAEIAHSIRIIANEVAHPNGHEPFLISQDDVEKAFDCLKELVHATYVQPAESRDLKRRLEEKGVRMK